MKIKRKIIKTMIQNYEADIKEHVKYLDTKSYEYNHYEPKYGPKENISEAIAVTYRVINVKNNFIYQLKNLIE